MLCGLTPWLRHAVPACRHKYDGDVTRGRQVENVDSGCGAERFASNFCRCFDEQNTDCAQFALSFQSLVKALLRN